MTRQTKAKFGFVLVVGIVLAIIIFKNFFGNEATENDEFDFKEEDATELYEQVDLDDFDSNSDVNEDEIEIEEAPDFEELYIEKFGKAAFEEAQEVAQEMMQMWIEEESDLTKWEKYSTSSFLKKIEKELYEYSDGVTREVKNLMIHSAQPNKKNEMRFGVIADWFILNNQEVVVSQQSKLFYITLIKQSERWIVKEIEEV